MTGYSLMVVLLPSYITEALGPRQLDSRKAYQLLSYLSSVTKGFGEA